MKKVIIFLFIYISVIIYPAGLVRDIDIIDMPLHDVLAVLSKESGRNLICTKESKDIAIDTYFNKGENIDEVLNYLAETYDLAIRRENDSTIFMLQSEKNSKKAKIIGQVFSNKKPLSSVKIELQDINRSVYTDGNGNYIIDDIPKDVYLCKISKNGYQEKGEMIAATKLINIVNIDLKEEEKTEEKKDFNRIENSNFYEVDGKYFYTKTFSLNNISTDDAMRILKETFGESIKISSLAKVNKLIVNAERDVLSNVVEIIDEIDKNPRQVKITSQILDISNNLFEELGFDWWYGKSGKNSLAVVSVGNVAKVASGALGRANIVRQFNNGDEILSLSINMLQATNDLVVSSVPTLMIASGEEGEFKVTEEVVVGVKTQRENKKDRYSEPVFKEAGLIMKVKPLIKDNDYVTLEINLELSDFKFKESILNLKERNSGTYNSEGGSKIGRSLSTKVRVKNGDTILLGGLKKSIQHSIENKIPILGDIPIINFFFKNKSKQKENSDMYIKLKVEIEE